MAACTETSLPTSGAIPKNLSCKNTNLNTDNKKIDNSNLSWQERLFGKQLINCKCNGGKTIVDVNSFLNVKTGDSLCEVIGIYFSFINNGGNCDDFTKQLAELYDKVNFIKNNGDHGNGNDMKIKKFEIVHVVLWCNVTEVIDFEQSFHSHVSDLPWLAVSNQDYERKVKHK